MLGNPKGLLIDNKKNLFSYPISEKESAFSTFVLLFLWAVASVVAVSQMLQAKYIRYRNPSLLLINSFQAQIWDDTTEFSQSNIELPLIPSPYLWWGFKSRHLFKFWSGCGGSGSICNRQRKDWSENGLSGLAWNMLLNVCQPHFYCYLPDASSEDGVR